MVGLSECYSNLSHPADFSAGTGSSRSGAKKSPETPFVERIYPPEPPHLVKVGVRRQDRRDVRNQARRRVHAIVSSELRRYFEGQGLPENLVRHRESRSEQSSDVGRHSGEITKCTPDFQVPDLFEDGDRRPAVCFTEGDSFENASAWISVARAGHCVDDDVRVDEEQLPEAFFDELVELVGSQEASASSENRLIGPPPVSFGNHPEMFVDCLSDQRGDRSTAALGFLLEVAALLWGQQDLESLAIHTHNIHIGPDHC